MSRDPSATSQEATAGTDRTEAKPKTKLERELRRAMEFAMKSQPGSDTYSVACRVAYIAGWLMREYPHAAETFRMAGKGGAS